MAAAHAAAPSPAPARGVGESPSSPPSGVSGAAAAWASWLGYAPFKLAYDAVTYVNTEVVYRARRHPPAGPRADARADVQTSAQGAARAGAPPEPTSAPSVGEAARSSRTPLSGSFEVRTCPMIPEESLLARGTVGVRLLHVLVDATTLQQAARAGGSAPAVLSSVAVASVVSLNPSSSDTKVQAGDIVLLRERAQWRDYQVVDEDALTVLQGSRGTWASGMLEPRDHLGLVGVAGLTALASLPEDVRRAAERAKGSPDDRDEGEGEAALNTRPAALVHGIAGAAGSLVGRLLRLAGYRVVGAAATAKRAAYAVEAGHANAAFVIPGRDRAEEEEAGGALVDAFAEAAAPHLPRGADLVWAAGASECVGGVEACPYAEVECAISLCRRGARVVLAPAELADEFPAAADVRVDSSNAARCVTAAAAKGVALVPSAMVRPSTGADAKRLHDTLKALYDGVRIGTQHLASTTHAGLKCIPEAACALMDGSAPGLAIISNI